MSRIGKSVPTLKHIGQNFTLEALCGQGVGDGVRLALESQGPAPRGRGLLQPALMFWLMIEAGLHRAEALPRLLARLLMPLRARGIELDLNPVTDGAIAHARAWFSGGALRHFFRWLCQRVQPRPLFHGLRVWLMDSTLFSVPDTPDNQRLFEVYKTPKGRCGYPMFKVTSLVDASTRRFRDVQRGLWRSSERSLALKLLRHLGPGDLVLLDRGFYGVWFLQAIRQRGAHFLIRVPNTVGIHASRRDRQRGDYRIRVRSRAAHRHGMPAAMDLRIVDYHIPGFTRNRLATSLDGSVPPLDLVRQYHVRWDIELAFDEIKTHLSAPAVGTPPTTLRSRTPDNVKQEFFALLAGYNLVRELMQAAALESGQPVQRISFAGALHALRLTVPEMQSSCACDLKRLFEFLIRDIAVQIIDRSRRPRSYPRVIKVRSKRCPVKKAKHKEKKLILDLNSITLGIPA